MDAHDSVRRIADGGSRLFHRECRECGQNFDPGQETCPVCGGAVAVYDL